MTDIALSFAALVPLLASTLFAEHVARLSPLERRRLSSFAGGTASAYVFLQVLPKLAGQQLLLQQEASGWPLIEYLYHHAYLLALLGFISFYLVNVLAAESDIVIPRSLRGALLVVGFGLYSAALGDLIAAQRTQPTPLALFSIALTLHLVGLNASLQARLRNSWRWLRVVLSICLLLGWIVALVSPIPSAIHALVSAWLAGGIIILVVLIELPRQRRPGAFVCGALAFAALLKLNLYLSGAEGGI